MAHTAIIMIGTHASIPHNTQFANQNGQKLIYCTSITTLSYIALVCIIKVGAQGGVPQPALDHKHLDSIFQNTPCTSLITLSTDAEI